jgi:hypothetical protein
VKPIDTTDQIEERFPLLYLEKLQGRGVGRRDEGQPGAKKYCGLSLVKRRIARDRKYSSDALQDDRLHVGMMDRSRYILLLQCYQKDEENRVQVLRVVTWRFKTYMS